MSDQDLHCLLIDTLYINCGKVATVTVNKLNSPRITNRIVQFITSIGIKLNYLVHYSLVPWFGLGSVVCNCGTALSSNSGFDHPFMPCSGYILFAAEQRVGYQIYPTKKETHHYDFPIKISL